jgi:VIT1/CCC1 family predicted Fe2+/Mn2+ transporter
VISKLDETMNAVADQEVDEISQKIITEIEHAKSKDLADSSEMIKILHLTNTRNAKALLEHAEEAPTKHERDLGKKAVVEALLVSTWHTRLYFIIRSFIMGLLGALLTLIFVLIFHSLTLALEIPLGIFSFLFTLTVSRLLDVQIVKATKAITDYLGDHKNLRNFILNHF